MSKKGNEQLMDAIGNVEEQYIREYMEAQHGAQGSRISERAGRPGKLRLTILLAALMIMLLGTVSIAAVFAVGHFHANDLHEQEAILKNFDSIASAYAIPVGGLQECDGVKGTLNSVLVEDHHLIFSYTFDWSGLEEAQNGFFRTWFLPWFFYIRSGDTVICQSEYTMGLHTQTYPDDPEDEFSDTFLYCIDLGNIEGRSLIGEELTVQLLYAEDGDGFTYTFTPEACFTDREWRIDKTYEFEGHRITLDSLRESALYITLFIDCEGIGRAGDEYQFIMSDELGNDYTVFPYEAEDTGGYWFTKPETVGSRLTLKIIRSNLVSDSYGVVTDDSYDVLYEIPIELRTSFRDKLR
ncbi:MAG: hypothetical protein NC121_17370 [Blautia sp.]|nr:hypothetical protein [Blautia sp.]